MHETDNRQVGCSERPGLSIVIPARNERTNLLLTIPPLLEVLESHGISHEVVVVDDGSTDGSSAVLRELKSRYPAFFHTRSPRVPGIGNAVRTGLKAARGDCVALVMADGSEDPEDIVLFYRKIEEGYACVFGSRFGEGGRVINYPTFKLLLNRLGNTLIRVLFGLRCDDTSNVFKCYRRDVIEDVQPLRSESFDIGLELPLKAVMRGHSYAVVPNAWRGRRHGRSSLSLLRMTIPYLVVILRCLQERHLSRRRIARELASLDG